MQGVFPPGSFDQLGLPGDWYKALEWQYPPHQRQGAYEEEGRAVNTLKVLPFGSHVRPAVYLVALILLNATPVWLDWRV